MISLRRLRDFFAENRFRLSRGQGYLSLVFWAGTLVNLVILNADKWLDMSFVDYVFMSLFGGGAIIFTVWFIGYLDVKYRLYSMEAQFGQSKIPIIQEIHENTCYIRDNLPPNTLKETRKTP